MPDSLNAYMYPFCMYGKSVTLALIAHKSNKRAAGMHIE